MANRENTTSAIENALNSAQAAFTANPAFLAPQTKHFFQAQERFFDEIEKFSTAWFQRRQDATQSLIEVGKRLSSEGRADPAGAIKEMMTWQTQEMERLAEDAKDCTEMLRNCAGSVAQNEVEAVEETAQAMTQTTKGSKAVPV